MQYCKNKRKQESLILSDNSNKDEENTEEILSGRLQLYRMQQANGCNDYLILEYYKEKINELRDTQGYLIDNIEIDKDN